ncbi:MAG: AAA family ATPase [Phycisphaerales bacterium]
MPDGPAPGQGNGSPVIARAASAQGGAPVPSGPRPRRIIAFMNQKGGVGKTTTTVNLAAAFARAGRSTLVVDLDPQAHASLHLGVDPGELESSVYNVLVDPGYDVLRAVRRARENLAVLPAVTDLAGAEHELSEVSDKQKRLENALLRLGDAYEFVLIDCPPSLGLLTINGLTAAREVVIPMQAHFLALQGVGKLLETVSLVRQAINPHLRVTGVVLCMHDNSSTHSREVVADMEAFFTQARETDTPWRTARVLRPAIRRNIKLAECPSFGQTIFEYAPSATSAEDYNALAWGLLGEWDAMLAARNASSPARAEPPAVEVPGRIGAAV